MGKTKQTELSGLLGETVSVRKVRGRVVIATHRPRPNKNLTPARAAVLEKFREAAQYAKRQVGLPDSLELYKSGIKGKMRSAYGVAFSDYLSVPKVQHIEAIRYRGNVGDAIAVKATDDFMVIGVKIVISASDGSVIEEGEARLEPTRINIWSYNATVINPALTGTTIKAIAFDRPGNMDTLEVTL